MNQLPKIFFLCIISLATLDAQNGGEAVAGVGSKILTQAELDGMISTASLDSMQAGPAKISAVRKWQASELIARQGNEQGVYDEIGTRMAGYLAWRNYLLSAVAKYQVKENFNGDRTLIEDIYNYHNTSILSRYLVAIDSLSAVEQRERWLAGGRFETLALNAFATEDLLALPGEPGWKYPKDLDTIYAQVAYNQANGEISQPILIDNKYYLIQTLRTHFQPDHGHFERVKHMENIASELPTKSGVNLLDAEADLDEWVTGLPIKWKRWSSRKVLKSGILASHQRSTAAEAPTAEILATVLFTLNGQDYNVDWVLERLELLPPRAQFTIENGTDLRQLINSLLKWNRLLATVANMPEADAIILEAENLRQTVIETTGWQTLQTRYLADYKIPDEILASYLRANQANYLEANLADVGEIIVDDSLLAAGLADSISAGTIFSELAADHSMRKWSQLTGGHLGWIPASLYSPHEDSLKFAAAGALVGPLSIGTYYVLLEVRDFIEAPEPTVNNRRERLRFSWLAEYKDSLITDWIWAMDRAAGLSWLDTNLVLGIVVPEIDSTQQMLELESSTPVLLSDSLTQAPDSMTDSSLAMPIISQESLLTSLDSSAVDTLIFEAGLSGADTVAIPDSILASPEPL
ncbi:hypothetical protein ACFL6E_05215 [Candidatus Neomarinimicrobiota bacterium]